MEVPGGRITTGNREIAKSDANTYRAATGWHLLIQSLSFIITHKHICVTTTHYLDKSQKHTQNQAKLCVILAKSFERELIEPSNRYHYII